MANFYAVQNPTFQPAMRNILTITNANPVLITTTYDGLVAGDHNYLTGLIVRIIIPWGFGMEQLNQYKGPITVINATQFTLPVDTTNFDPFVIPPFFITLFGTPAQVVPIGEVTEMLTMATQNVLPYP